MEHHHYSNHATQQEQSHEQQPTHIDQYDMTGAFDFLDVVPPQIDQNHALHYDLPMDMHQHLLPDNFYDLSTLSADGSASPETDLLPYESSIPHYYKPVRPCQHCASRQLECKIFRTAGNAACASCTYLFRPCSFVEAPNATDGRINLLHVVSEGVPQDNGEPTRIEPLFTAGASSNDISHEAEAGSARQGKTSRFSRQVLQILRAWLVSHADHPYPDDEEKFVLSQQTGLNRSQISNWLANARRRGKVRPRVITPAIPIPAGSEPEDQSNLTPFDRWKSSPPENEASLLAIRENAASSEFQSESSPPNTAGDLDSSACSAPLLHHPRRCPSDTSCETLRSVSSMSLETGSLLSRNSSENSYGSYISYKRKDRRRRTVAKKPSLKNNVARPFQCTFCVADFFTKHDHSRHEKSVHLNLEKWVCCPSGYCETDRLTGISTCAYCGANEPTAAHAEFHDHSTCVSKGLHGREFIRKDHLRQHLRLVHCVRMAPHMEAWRTVPKKINSRCGFCAQTFKTWDERASHLAAHFRRGTTMASWKGGWGFDQDVAACVREAIHPESIENERGRLLLRGGGRADSQASNARGSASQPSPVQITAVLRHFAQASQSHHVPVTDEALRAHARVVVHGSDDPQNKTSADDEAWLTAFKSHFKIETAPQPAEASSNNPFLDSHGTEAGSGLGDPSLWLSELAAQGGAGQEEGDLLWPMEAHT